MTIKFNVVGEMDKEKKVYTEVYFMAIQPWLSWLILQQLTSKNMHLFKPNYAIVHVF